MKKLLVIVVLSLSLITPSLADDIRDLQIEGISIGDSALDHFSKNEIENKKKKGLIYKSKKFYSATFRKKSFFKEYDAVQLHLKPEDKKYIIYSVAGQIYYSDNNINKCYPKMDEIVLVIKDMFENATIDEYGKRPHAGDKTSTVSTTYIDLESGDYITVECYDWSDDKQVDNLLIAIDSKEFSKWLQEEAY